MKRMPKTEPLHEIAHAKVNLALHVTGQRRDGYHLLDSLVVFAKAGDRLALLPHETGLHLAIDGPFSNALDPHDNLVLRAGRMMMPSDSGGTLRLTKNLPVAAGLGGGSADAAAMLRLGARYWRCPLPDLANQLRLGADVPACLMGGALHMQGIGEVLRPVRTMPKLHMVLINPGIELATPAVFAALTQRQNASLADLPDSPRDFGQWLHHQRNDLQATAIQLCPAIGDCLAALVHHGAVLARMSGSGASCFGLFETAHLAEHAAGLIDHAAPGWWVQASDTV